MSSFDTFFVFVALFTVNADCYNRTRPLSVCSIQKLITVKLTSTVSLGRNKSFKLLESS